MDVKEYKRIWMRKYRKRKRREQLLSHGHCPVCTILLNPEYEKYHYGCPYYENVIKPQTIHEKVEITEIIISN